MTTPSDLSGIFNDGVLVDLDIGCWSALARNRADDLGLVASDVPDFVAGLGTKELVDKATRKHWLTLIGHARYTLRKHSFTFPIADVAFVPLAALPAAEAELRAIQGEFFTRRDALLRNYAAIKAASLSTRQRRAVLEAAWPTRDDLERQFYFTWVCYTIALPKKLKVQILTDKKRASMAAAEARYQRELEARYGVFLEKSVALLRAKTAQVCRTLADKVRSGDVVTNRSLTALREWVDRFKLLNFQGDTATEARLNDLKALMLGRDAETFESDEALTKSLGGVLDEVIATVNRVTDVSKISGAYRRRIAL